MHIHGANSLRDAWEEWNKKVYADRSQGTKASEINAVAAQRSIGRDVARAFSSGWRPKLPGPLTTAKELAERTVRSIN
jgi:hypothetical protein